MEEKKQIKVSLGTTICIFIIILLLIVLVGMYLYFDKDSKNNANNIVKVNSEVEMQEKEENELYKVSDFELINNSLINTEYNNLKSFITSENEIEEVIVNEITIYTEEYLKATGNSLSVDSKENEISGSCVFTIRFKDIEGLALEGSKGNPHGKVGNCLVDQKEFVFDKTTNKIELCTGLVWKENDESSVKENNNQENANVETKNNVSETINKLSKEDTYFVIEDIKEKEDKYEITAYILEKGSIKIRKEEYEGLLEGKTITFRNLEWKYDKDYTNTETTDIIYIKSGEYRLAVCYDKMNEEGNIENVAGSKSGGLRDYSNEKITFEVDGNIKVGDVWTVFKYDNNGELKLEQAEDAQLYTIKELLEWYDNDKGSYCECKAYVVDGEVEAIRIFQK